MATTQITLAITHEGKPIALNVEMTGEELEALLTGGRRLVRLPTGGGSYSYVNPAHIVMAQELREDAEPMIAVIPRRVS